MSGLEVGLANRVAVLEVEAQARNGQLDDCLHREAKSDAMFKEIHSRLDESGLGKNGTK